MKIFCHNRPMAQVFASDHASPLTIISITDPGQLQPQFPPECKVHRFEFLDIEFDAALRQTDGGLYLVGKSAKSDGPTQELAAQLAEVIRSVQGDLLVHCEQGRSRSVAVALAAHLYLNVPLNIWHPHMAKDHKYYKRRETKSEAMDHYEVEDVRNRSRGALLRLNVFFDYEEFMPMGIKRKFFETERSFPIKLFAENLVSQPAEYGAVNFFLDFRLRERDKMLQSKMYYSNEFGLDLDGRYGFYRHHFQIGLPQNAPIWQDNPVMIQEISFSFPKDLSAMEIFYFGWDISSPYMPKQRQFYQMQTIIDRPGTASICGVSEI